MAAKKNVATPLKDKSPTPPPSGTFVPNKTPPPTDDPVAALKPGARAEKAAKREGVQSLTGKTLTGDALTKFQAVWEGSSVIRAMYNKDGSLQSDAKKILE